MFAMVPSVIQKETEGLKFNPSVSFYARPSSGNATLSSTPSFGALVRRHGPALRVPRSIMIDQPADHGLIGSMMLFRLGLEEFHAGFAQSHGDLDVVFLENEFLGRGEKVIHHAQFSHRFICVFNLALHKSSVSDLGPGAFL